MKIQHLISPRYREDPAGYSTESHAWMLRGGYMRAVANGTFSQYPALKRIMRKVEQIMREEMDAIGGQEVEMPYVVPASLWQESGRYGEVGVEMIRFNDRKGTQLVLSMTHEEASVQLVRGHMRSYTQYPFMFYQTQSRFRDEPRPRAGLIRAREFAMNDAYSFHTTVEDMAAYYEQYVEAYHRIFARVGLPQVLAVESDPGMMGGRVSHEWMLPSEIGEDSVATCSKCGWTANVDISPCIYPDTERGEETELTLVYTPNIHSAEDVCTQLNWAERDTCKSVVYQREDNGAYVVLFIRADLEVNEAKLSKYLGCAIIPAEIRPDSGLHAGYIGPVGLEADCIQLFDRSLEGRNGLLCGANREEYHYTGLDMPRDVRGAEYHDFAKITNGGVCPRCGKPVVNVFRAIELAHSFQFGDRYTRSMDMIYLDENGERKHPYMASCGVGLGRLVAAVCEVYHDDGGPIWPMSIAPWQVHICAIHARNFDDSVVESHGEALYQELLKRGVEVIYDDRKMYPGGMLADADLFGVPFRAIVSPRHLKNGGIEIVSRDRSFSEVVPVDAAADRIMELLAEAGCRPSGLR